MALTVTSRGTGTHNTGATTLVPGGRTATLAVGSMGVLCIALDNAGSAGSTLIAPNSWTDAKANVWTLRENRLYDNGAASAGIEMAFYTAPITVALLTTDLGTMTWKTGVSPVAKAWTWYEVIPSGSNTVAYSTGGDIAGATAANAQVTTGTIAVGNAVIAGYFSENVAAVTQDSDSTNGSWTAQQTATVGTTTSGVRIATQQKVQTTTPSTQSYDVTVSSQDRIAGYIVLAELVAVTGTGVGTGTASTASGAGAETFTGTGAGGGTASSATGSAAETFTATGAGTGAASTASGTGYLIDATGAGEQTPASASGTGTVEESGATGTGAGEQVAPSGSGEGLLLNGEGAGTGAAATASGSGAETFTGTGAGTGTTSSASGTAIETFTGTGVGTGAAATAAGVAVESIAGTGTGVGVGATASGLAFEIFTGTGAGVGAAPSGTGSDLQPITGMGGGVTAPPSSSGLGIVKVSARPKVTDYNIIRIVRRVSGRGEGTQVAASGFGRGRVTTDELDFAALLAQVPDAA